MDPIGATTALWLAVGASGLYHGLNPGMGWPLAVSTALMERRDGALWRALAALGAGHLLAMLAILAPFAAMTLSSIQAADPKNPTVDEVPYVGVQFVAIPEFQGIGTAVGQQFSAALAGQITVEQALANAQTLTEREMKRAGY